MCNWCGNAIGCAMRARVLDATWELAYVANRHHVHVPGTVSVRANVLFTNCREAMHVLMHNVNLTPAPLTRAGDANHDVTLRACPAAAGGNLTRVSRYASYTCCCQRGAMSCTT